MYYPDDISPNSGLAPWNASDSVFTVYDKSFDQHACHDCKELDYVDSETGLCSECWKPKEVENE